MIFIGILAGLGASTMLINISDWIEDRYMENYMNEITNELESEEIQKMLKTQ